jgi:GR25 family glycosyltransferase involved in LPS biosynthesis
MINFKEDLYASYVNMDHRVDRNNHMIAELEKAGISAVRQRGMPYHEYNGPQEKVWVMEKRTKGAIGCHMSQVAIMEKAYMEGKSAFVMEDDLIFCSDIQDRLSHIENFVNKQKEWDIVWLGGTVHVNPSQWYTGNNPDLKDSNLGYDAELTSDNRMLRTYGAFSTYAYIVNKDSIPKILKMLDDNIHLSMGIDWLFIKLQPQLKTFMYVPGCVKQMDSMSDIGGAMTTFSNFGIYLNGTPEKSAYWFQDRKEDFNPDTFDWAEARDNKKEEEPNTIPFDIDALFGDNEANKQHNLNTAFAIEGYTDMPFSAQMNPIEEEIEVVPYPITEKYYRCFLLGCAVDFVSDLSALKGLPVKVIHEISKSDFENKVQYSIPLNQWMYHL